VAPRKGRSTFPSEALSSPVAPSVLQRGARRSPPPGGDRPLPPPASVYDYGVIGNLHTAALVSRFGTVDWCCLPRFAAPSVFARLLDPDLGGTFSVGPREPAEGRQSYLGETNLLGTTFDLPRRRRLTVVDFMPVLPAAPAGGVPLLVRIVEAEGGPVDVRAVCAPRFRYGDGLPAFAPAGEHWVARSGEDALWIRMPGAGKESDVALASSATVVPGRPLELEVAWGAARPDVPPPAELRRATEEFWVKWGHEREKPVGAATAEWHRWTSRSELVLKLLSRADTGAFVAAPTTSLPEWPGADRNWDYRFVWIRDASLTAEILLSLGHEPEAKRFLTWVFERLQGRDPTALGVLYGAHGETDLSERTLDRFRGFLDSRPVRVGNGASEQFQLDIFGELFDAVDLLVELEPSFAPTAWRSMGPVAAALARVWQRPDNGIWEVRGPPAFYVYSRVMAWVGFDRAVRLAERAGDTASSREFRPFAERVRAEVMSRGIDPATGAFVQAYDRPRPDASNLRIPHVGFLPYDDPHVRATVEWTERELADGPYVYRYRGGDGFASPEGAFLPCSFWLVVDLARGGDLARARAHLARILDDGGPLGLFSEEYDPKGRRPLGNYPQAFSHIGLLRAIEAIAASSLPAGQRLRFPWLRRHR
jgi:alpha,alpha-trehalase